MGWPGGNGRGCWGYGSERPDPPYGWPWPVVAGPDVTGPGCRSRLVPPAGATSCAGPGWGANGASERGADWSASRAIPSRVGPGATCVTEPGWAAGAGFAGAGPGLFGVAAEVAPRSPTGGGTAVSERVPCGSRGSAIPMTRAIPASIDPPSRTSVLARRDLGGPLRLGCPAAIWRRRRGGSRRADGLAAGRSTGRSGSGASDGRIARPEDGRGSASSGGGKAGNGGTGEGGSGGGDTGRGRSGGGETGTAGTGGGETGEAGTGKSQTGGADTGGDGLGENEIGGADTALSGASGGDTGLAGSGAAGSALSRVRRSG